MIGLEAPHHTTVERQSPSPDNPPVAFGAGRFHRNSRAAIRALIRQYQSGAKAP
jgi:hypothetical protein